MIRGHGGNIYALAQEVGCTPSDIIDMSSNVNPLGPPPGLVDFLRDNLKCLTALPEVDSAGIRQDFAARYGLDPERVLAGNGTTQIIYSLPQALGSRKALVLAPAYADYADACALHGVECVCLISRLTSRLNSPGADSFSYTISQIIEAIETSGADLVFICNPNNPTGVFMPPANIVEICGRFPQVKFVIDESYLPFVGQGESLSLIHQTDLSNIIVLNSMSKIFKIPGLRIGLAVSAPSLINQLEPYILPWSSNSLSQIAVHWLMTHQPEVRDFVSQTVESLEKEKSFFKKELAALEVVKLLPSSTSFILAVLEEPLKAEEVCHHLGQQRLLIRNCANFAGLSSQYIRISLKSRRENALFATAMQQLIGGKPNL